MTAPGRAGPGADPVRSPVREEVGGSPYAEIYHPASGSWTYSGALHVPRTFAAQVALGGGAALSVGGFAARVTSPTQPISSADAERFDATAGWWTPVATLPTGVAAPATLTLPDGGVLVAGGLAGAGSTDAVHLLAAAGSTVVRPVATPRAVAGGLVGTGLPLWLRPLVGWAGVCLLLGLALLSWDRRYRTRRSRWRGDA